MNLPQSIERMKSYARELAKVQKNFSAIRSVLIRRICSRKADIILCNRLPHKGN